MMTNRMKSTRIAPVEPKGPHPTPPTPPTPPTHPLMNFPPFERKSIYHIYKRIGD